MLLKINNSHQDLESEVILLLNSLNQDKRMIHPLLIMKVVEVKAQWLNGQDNKFQILRFLTMFNLHLKQYTNKTVKEETYAF